MGQTDSAIENEDINNENLEKQTTTTSSNILTDSEVACEETAQLTADQQQQENDDDEVFSYCDYHDLPPPPDGGYGWVVVFASFLCNMIVDGIAYTFGIFLTPIVQHYGESKGKTAWVGSLLSGVYLSVGPIVSALTNRFGCRTVCIAGSLVATAAFALSTLCPTVNWLMLVYGFLGGVGFGLIYLPAVVCVGYYFETKRSLATGIAVCGSGVGTFAFAPLAATLLELYGWRGANLILAGMILCCALCGALMRPLRYPKTDEDHRQPPLLQRMAEERRIQMERGSITGSYFMVQLPDGTMERRQKQPLNIDPGVHSSLNLDQLTSPTPAPNPPLPTVPTLPTITEAKVSEQSSSGSPSPGDSTVEIQPPPRPVIAAPNIQKPPPRNASQPAFTHHHQGLPKNGSVPTFDRIRKTSLGDRIQRQPRPTTSPSPTSNGECMKRMRNNSNASFQSGRNNNSEVDVESLAYTTSKMSLSPRITGQMVRPFSRKDIFYSGSVVNLPEYHQSQKSLTNYRQSIMSIPRPGRSEFDAGTGEPGDICPCLVLPDSFKMALNQMLDMSLLKDPVFLMIGFSNLFGMAGLYVPFVYLVECAIQDGIDASRASFLLSIIGITNTFGRVACGYFADFPAVNALLVNNICLVISTLTVLLTPFCTSYASYIVMAIFFGTAISGYISLTSIILVDLLGLDKLTNAFGLLILFRGAAAIVGSPLAGAIYDATASFDIPFYVAGGFFALSTVTSFLAPCVRRFAPKSGAPIGDVDDQLTPIDEDEEVEEEDDDQPITIMDRRPNGHVMRDGGTVPPIANEKQPEKILLPPPPQQQIECEIKQIESVL